MKLHAFSIYADEVTEISKVVSPIYKPEGNECRNQI